MKRLYKPIHLLVGAVHVLYIIYNQPHVLYIIYNQPHVLYIIYNQPHVLYIIYNQPHVLYIIYNQPLPIFQAPMKRLSLSTSSWALCMYFICCRSWQKLSLWRTWSNTIVSFPLRPSILMSRRQLFVVLFMIWTTEISSQNHYKTIY